MELDYSSGDFVGVSTLAWTVYKSCKEAPESFNNISLEVLSLHAVLKEGDEVLTLQSFSVDQKSRLDMVLSGCHSVLHDLRKLVQKYESLGSQTRRTWDRMRWGLEDIAEMRSRLTSNVALLSAFIRFVQALRSTYSTLTLGANQWLSTSQVVVEKRLKSIMRDFQDGRREGSVITSKTVESMSVEDKETWREIKNELEEAGITLAALNLNKDFIINWLKENSTIGAPDVDMSMDQQSEGSTDALNRAFSSAEFSSAPSSRHISPATSVSDLASYGLFSSRIEPLTLDIGNTHREIAPKSYSPSNKHDWTFFVSPSKTNAIKDINICLASNFVS